MRKIKEIFWSIQGEGRNVGMPAVFVRFSGCNLRCPFCDEHHNDGVNMEDSEIISQIKQYDCPNVILTGGEPALHIDDVLIEMLHRENFFVCVETNGTKQLPKGIDFITLSPKDFFCKNAAPVITRCDELKVVFNGIDIDMQRYDNIQAKYRYIQPCDFGDREKNSQIVTNALEWLSKNSNWRLSMQVHKILKLK